MGTPLVHVENKVTESAWIRYSNIPALKRPNVLILQGRVVEIDPLRKCAFWRSSAASENDPDRVLQYDYLIAATGLQRDWPILPRSFTRQQYILDAKEHIAKLKATRNHPIVVVGGGKEIKKLENRLGKYLTDRMSKQEPWEPNLQPKSNTTTQTTGSY